MILTVHGRTDIKLCCARIRSTRLQIGDQLGDILLIDSCHQSTGAELTLPLPCFRRQNVTGERMTPLDFASTSLFEALGSATICLDLWHFCLL